MSDTGSGEEFLFGDWQPEELLDGRQLPERPSGLEPGQYLPFATWRNDEYGAVGYLYRNKPDDFEEADEEFELYVAWLPRSGNEWSPGNSNYSSCSNPWEDRSSTPLLGIKQISEAYFTDEPVLCAVAAICSDDVAYVEVHRDGEILERITLGGPLNGFAVGVVSATQAELHCLTVRAPKYRLDKCPTFSAPNIAACPI